VLEFSDLEGILAKARFLGYFIGVGAEACGFSREGKCVKRTF